MPFVLPADPADGDVAPASWGDDVRNSLNFLANPPACRVYNSATQSCASGAEIVVAFNSERHDTDTMHDTVTANSRITVVTAGLYILSFSGEWASGSDYTQAYAYLRMNGTTPIAVQSTLGTKTTVGGVHIGCTTIYKLAAGSFVEVVANQVNTAAAARNLQAIGNYTPEFSATWIGLG